METIIKKAVLLTLLASALICTFAIPLDDSPTWVRDIVASKITAILCWILFALLNKEWKIYCHEG